MECLLNYASDDQNALVKRAAIQVDKILKGAKPADVAVEKPAKFKLLVNLKAAKAIDAEIPLAFLLCNDEVIE